MAEAETDEPEVQQAIEPTTTPDARSSSASDDTFAGVIVALGASAGGLDALDRFFSSLPPLPALQQTAFVVVQHLAPEHKTMMDTLLARHTRMTVLVASDGVLLEGGHVYVIPPGTTMTVSHGRLRLVPRPTTGVTMPIDAFFESLALEASRRDIGIVLSGTGSDGTRGVTALDETGAWVMAQEPRTASFDGMPRNAIGTGAVDHVLSPELLAAEVAVLVASGDEPPPRPPGPRLRGDDSALGPVLRLLSENMRVDFAQYKPTTVVRRVERRVQATGTDSLQAYADQLVTDRDEVDTLRRELLIPVTRFFRDPDAFVALRHALADMVRDREPERVLRCWVTPCSTGEEAYSIALVLLELIEEHAPGTELKLFATDVESTYLDRAGAGTYSTEQVASIPVEHCDRWFEQLDADTWRVRSALRQKIVFARHDLLSDAPFTQLDVVSCRNLLIYLRAAAQDRAIRRLSYGLRPGGILFLGTSETPGQSAEHYDVIDARQKVYRLRRRPGPLPPDDVLIGGEGSRSARARDIRGRHDDPRALRPVNQQALEVLARRYAPPAVVVTAQRQLVRVIGDPSGILRIGPGDSSLDIASLLPPALAPVVATLVHAASREMAPQRSRVVTVTDDPVAGPAAQYRVAVWPMHGTDTVAEHADAEHLLVCFEPADVPEASVAVAEGDLSEMRTRHVDDLERELALTRANLHETIQDLGTANEELQATNEELMAANEELQSTNEELQSVNEELHTVNAEFQSKITDLNDANADLESLTRATRIPLVFVDASLRLTRFTPAATALFRFRASDLGRPITDFSHELDYPDLYERIDAALSDIAPFQREVSDRSGRSWLVTVLPYAPRDPDDARVVITCVDVSSVRDVRRLQAVLDALPEHVAVLDRQGVILQVNRAWSEFAERNGDEGMRSCGPGIDYLSVCAAADRDPEIAHVADGIRGVLDGSQPSFAVHYPCHSADEQRWFLMHATPMAGGGCVITHFDVTPWIDLARAQPVPGDER